MAAELILAIAALIVAIPAFFLALQLFCSLGKTARPAPVENGPPEGRLAILVPAHDEEAHLLATLESIGSQVERRDRIMVVADNCTDDTQAIAAQFGATVVVRDDPDRRGKGHALAFGLDHMRSDPADFVAIVDADCQLAPGTLSRLHHAAAQTGRPVQACYLMKNPPGASDIAGISEFAFAVKNMVRPLGMMRLGLPVHLVGTGMIFPWHIIESAEIDNGEIVEDMKLGADLVRAGLFPVFCPDTLVTSRFPAERDAALVQRRRWEHGHLGVALSCVPGLVMSGLRSLDYRKIGFALDLTVPPLALLVLVNLLLLLVFGLMAAFGLGYSAMLIVAAALFCLSAGLFLVWYRFGRTLVPPGTLLKIPAYIIGKIAIYLDLFGNREKKWIRTKRAPADDDRPESRTK